MSTRNQKKPSHEAGSIEWCIACTDPDRAAKERAYMRDRMKEYAAKAREHRAIGEHLREEIRTADLPHAVFTAKQAEMLHHLGTANAMFDQIMMWRGDLERIEEAHGLTKGNKATP
ncbi:hypothetical protein [Actinomadura fulvescens]